MHHKQLVNVYDFDGTLYRGDSTRDFLVWCARRFPGVAATLPRTGLAAVACFGTRGRLLDKTRFKRSLYRFLTRVPDVEREVERFWAAHGKLVGEPCAAAPGDLVISAGPEFLLRDVCAARGLRLVASQVDPHTGRVLGPNCSGAEKVARLHGAFPGAQVERFYSDSHADDPLAAIAQEAWMVRDGALEPWEFGNARRLP